jgi:ketosteroid isomerase-like protein
MMSDVSETMARYGRAIDSRDFELLKTCFTDDAVIRYAEFGEEIHGREGLVDYLENSLSRLDATQHLFGNFEVETDGSQGRMRCYVQAQHVRLDAPGGHLFTVAGRYDNAIVCGDDGLWRMTSLTFEPMWTGGNEQILDHVATAST